MIVLTTDSFSWRCSFPVGPFRLAGHRPEGTAELFVRSPASAWPAVRGLCVHGDSACLLCHLPAASSRNRLFGLLLDHDHERPVAERTDLVPLVLLDFDLVACLLFRPSPDMLDPINRLSLHGRRRPAVFFAVMFRHRRVLRSRTD